MKSITINLFSPLAYGFGIWTCTTGRTSWWVLALILMFSIKLNVKFGKGL